MQALCVGLSLQITVSQSNATYISWGRTGHGLVLNQWVGSSDGRAGETARPTKTVNMQIPEALSSYKLVYENDKCIGFICCYENWPSLVWFKGSL